MPQTPRSQSDAAEALIAVGPLVSRWVERLLARHDPPLTVSQYLALRAIASGDLTGAELARRTGVSGPAVSQLLATLADGGMLERRADPDDRRNQTLTLSSIGAQTFRSADAELRRTVGGLLADVPRPEADALGRLLRQVEAVLGGKPPPRRPSRPAKPPPPGHRPHGRGRP